MRKLFISAYGKEWGPAVMTNKNGAEHAENEDLLTHDSPASALRSELEALNPSVLRKRAVRSGALRWQLDDADDDDDTKAALVELILKLELPSAKAAARCSSRCLVFSLLGFLVAGAIGVAVAAALPCECGWSGAFCDTASFCPTAHPSPLFPGTKIVTAQWGAQINNWTSRAADGKWARCYSSFTNDSSSPSTFHRLCDPHAVKLTVGHNDAFNHIFGGYVRTTLASCSPRYL